MILMSQNRKIVMDCVKLTVEKNITFKNDKYAIVGTTAGTYPTVMEVLGTYPDEKTALDELERLMSSMSEGNMVNYVK